VKVRIQVQQMPLSMKTIKEALVAFSICVCTLGSSPSPAGAQQSSDHLSPPEFPVPATYFGVHLHRPSAATWPQVPFTEWRLWDSKGTVWYDLEPHKGDWEFSQLDQDVALAKERHVEVLLTLGQSPPWASSRPNDPPSWRPGGVAPPKDEEDWKDYVRTVAARYRGRIRQYEIWNEPNLKDSYSGTREQLIVLARDAYRIIHQIDPTAIVVSPSVTGGYDVGWLIHYLDLGGGDYADVIGYHFYTSPESPESGVKTIRQVRAAMAAHGIDKPLWDTETGYTIQSDLTTVVPPKGSLSRLLSHQEAIAYVMRAYALNWAAGATRLYWYDWDGNSMGLGDELGRRRKPAAAGYTVIQQWLAGVTMRSCDQDGSHNWTCELSNGRSAEWIVWNSDRGISRRLPAAWKVSRAETLSANGTSISTPLGADRTVVCGPIPTLLH
jgi:hypothetical protein